MQAYVEGDAEAFQRLFDALAPAVHAFFARTLRGATASDDLTQTTFLKIHASRRQWRPGNGVRPWVFSIAAHVRADWLRSRERDATEPYDDEAMSAADASAEDPGAAAGRRERGERVQAALDSLTAAQRVVVHLHRFEGLGFAEIGTILGISEGAAKLRAFRAYEELRRRLGDLAREETP